MISLGDYKIQWIREKVHHKSLSSLIVPEESLALIVPIVYSSIGC